MIIIMSSCINIELTSTKPSTTTQNQLRTHVKAKDKGYNDRARPIGEPLN